MSDDPKPADPAAVAEPEPEGVVEVQGKRLVPVDAIVAERERARTKAEEKYKTELEPLKQKAAQADQLASDLAALKPQLDYVRANWEQIQAAQKKATDIPDVSDEDAEKFARRYELYRDNGLDVHRAKQMIVDQRAETKRIASQVAQEAVAPYAQTAAAHAARENFMWAANQKAPDGSPQLILASWRPCGGRSRQSYPRIQAWQRSSWRRLSAGQYGVASGCRPRRRSRCTAKRLGAGRMGTIGSARWSAA